MEYINDNFEDDISTVETTVAEERHYANFGFRLLAYVIDLVVIFSLNGLFVTPLKMLNNGIPIEYGLWTANALLAGLIYYLYFFIMTQFFQQTIGKMIVGIQVIDVTGGRASMIDVFFREVIGRSLHNIFWFLKLLYLVILVTDKKQGVHDLIANTAVIYVK